MSNLTGITADGQPYGNETLLLLPYLCTIQTCDLSLASFLYIPTLGGNAFYAVVFGLLLIGQLVLGIKHKTWGYMSAMVLGLLLEIVGYAGRIQLHNNPFSNDSFLQYLVTLTIAPALMTASIYLCLARIVNVYGEELSRFKPRTYTIVFCTFDFICLLLQAIGGALASTADDKKGSDLGRDIMLAGLIFQVVSLGIFVVAASDYAIRVIKAKGTWKQKHAEITHSALFKAFLAGLLVATVTIFVRCIYRCVELSGGFNSELFISHEAIFMVFEGAMIIIACSCLTFLHPAVCFQGAWDESNFRFRAKKGNAVDHEALDMSHSYRGMSK